MAKKAPAKPRQRKPKQPFLDGMEPPNIPAIETAAEQLAEVRAERMRLTGEETEAADALLVLMHEHELKVYDCQDGKRVEVAALEKVKVKRAKEESNGEAE